MLSLNTHSVRFRVPTRPFFAPSSYLTLGSHKKQKHTLHIFFFQPIIILEAVTTTVEAAGGRA